MSIEWMARVNRPYTLEAFASRTKELLGELLGRRSPHEYAVDVKVVGEGSWRLAPEELLRTPRDPFGDAGTREVDVRLVSSAARAIVDFSLAEYVPRAEDVDTGMFAFITSARSNESEVLSIAAVCAAAELGASQVVDERGYFGEERFTPPRLVVDRLKVLEADLPLATAVRAILAKTSLRRDYEPLTDSELG
jgi:hypothetical protein